MENVKYIKVLSWYDSLPPVESPVEQVSLAVLSEIVEVPNSNFFFFVLPVGYELNPYFKPKMVTTVDSVPETNEKLRSLISSTLDLMGIPLEENPSWWWYDGERVDLDEVLDSSEPVGVRLREVLFLNGEYSSSEGAVYSLSLVEQEPGTPVVGFSLE
jgi:hypothetical protein